VLIFTLNIRHHSALVLLDHLHSVTARRDRNGGEQDSREELAVCMARTDRPRDRRGRRHAFPATAVAAVATCAAAACAAATCAAFVAKVSIGAQRQVHQPVDPLSARSTPELPRRIGTAARASTLRACTAGKAMASCPDGSLDIIWPVTDSAVT
jgi:hypothetical protein